MFDVNEIIEVNNKSYLITHKLVHNSKTYYYISSLNEREITLVEEEINDNESFIDTVSDPKEIELILSIMLKEELK